MGWEPRETHQHEYDDEGRIARTIVTRETEWDDMERAKMLALADYRASLCECGFPAHVADEDPDLQIRYRVCPVCAGVTKALRIQGAQDDDQVKALGKSPAPSADLPTDGRSYRLESKPDSPPAEQAEGDAQEPEDS